MTDKKATHRALCVDLDGSLIDADIVWECLLRTLKRAPWRLLLMPFWLLRGRQHLKMELARDASVDVRVLPYNRRVLSFVDAERTRYSQVVLVTGSVEPLARQVAAHLGLFDAVIATDATRNLTGSRKAAALVERFGEKGFDYLANGRVDLKVWPHAARAVTVNATAGTVAMARKVCPETIDLGTAKAGMRAWLKALRLHQWAKNALIFVPLLTAHRLDSGAVATALAAFAAFGLCASATYIINDLLDLDADRHHKTKHRRPFASGALSIPAGLLVCATLLVASAAITLQLPAAFALTLGAYLASTLLYSFKLKRVASLDVIMLAGLYTLRVIAGGLAIGVPLSFWLLAFSMFVFLCLALVKRVSELLDLAAQDKTSIMGREYAVQDIPVLQTLGASSGYIAVLVLALYINSDEVNTLYASPAILWLIAPLMLLWMTRLWVVTTRGYMDQDPIVWAIKDPETWITAAVTAVILYLATTLSL